MDPTANLAEQRAIVARIIGNDETEGDPSADWSRLAELVDALDTWIRNGGFLPEQWQGPHLNTRR